MPKKATIVSAAALVLLLALIMILTLAVKPGVTSVENAMPKRVSVFFPEKNEIRIMKYGEFIGGCVAGMLPHGAELEPEALKALAAAANSRALYHLKNKNPSESFGADFVAGEVFPFVELDEKQSLISRITDGDLFMLMYEGEPINAQTCKISAGVTDETEHSPSVPLLCDINAKGYQSSTAFTYETVRRSLHANGVTRNFEEWFHDPVYAETGTLIYVGFCDTNVTGAALRMALNLRSTAITVEYREEKFYFYCKGLGENKGMSANAAIFLAQNGKTAEEILKLFYPECELKK